MAWRSATFLLGDVNQFQRFVSTSLNAAERQKRWFFYGQDTWRISTKLTLNYGLRWEIYNPEYVNGKGNGGFANLDQGVIRVAGYGDIGLNGNIDNTLQGVRTAHRCCLPVRSQDRRSPRLRPQLRHRRVRLQLRPRGDAEPAGSRQPDDSGHQPESCGDQQPEPRLHLGARRAGASTSLRCSPAFRPPARFRSLAPTAPRARESVPRFSACRLSMRGTPPFSARSLRICPSKSPTSATKARTRSIPTARPTTSTRRGGRRHQPRRLCDSDDLRPERFRPVRSASRSPSVLPERRAVIHLSGLHNPTWVRRSPAARST